MRGAGAHRLQASTKIRKRTSTQAELTTNRKGMEGSSTARETMSVEDFRINAGVRQVLSRNWVDLQPLSFGAAGRVVYFHGKFQKIAPSAPAEGEPARGAADSSVAENLALLESVEKQVRGDPLVVDVVFRLDNFKKVHGEWSSTG
jgi:hypothetical protein